MKTSEVLRKAADEIRRRGWYQGDYGSDETSYRSCKVCALGAVNAAFFDGDPFVGILMGDWTRRRAITLLEEVVGGNVGVWNDQSARTVEEVLDAFEKAAELAEEQDD